MFTLQAKVAQMWLFCDGQNRTNLTKSAPICGPEMGLLFTVRFQSRWDVKNGRNKLFYLPLPFITWFYFSWFRMTSVTSIFTSVGISMTSHPLLLMGVTSGPESNGFTFQQVETFQQKSDLCEKVIIVMQTIKICNMIVAIDITGSWTLTDSERPHRKSLVQPGFEPVTFFLWGNTAIFSLLQPTKRKGYFNFLAGEMWLMRSAIHCVIWNSTIWEMFCQDDIVLYIYFVFLALPSFPQQTAHGIYLQWAIN